MMNAKKFRTCLLPLAMLLAVSSLSARSEPDAGAEPEARPDVVPLDAVPDVSSEVDSAMTGERLIELVARIDPGFQRQGNAVQFSLRERPVMLVFDPDSGRMRVLSPVAQAGILDASLMRRMLQANFDSALDARYALANEIVWSVFIHPLAELSESQFSSALAQVVVAAETFGTTFTSGALVYGGGDSNEENRKLMEHLDKLIKPEI